MATRKRASPRSRLNRAVKAGRAALRSAEKRVPPDVRKQIDRSIKDGQKRLDAAVKDVRKRVNQAARQADLDRVMEYKTLKFGVYRNPLWQSMQHLVNHGTYHRGQVTTLLRQLGAKAIATDLMHFYRERMEVASS